MRSGTVKPRQVGLSIQCPLSVWCNLILNPNYFKFHCYCPQIKLRKGNVFTPVCQSFCSRGGCLPQCMLGYTPPADTPLGRHPPPSRRLLLRTVRILLECILATKLLKLLADYHVLESTRKENVHKPAKKKTKTKCRTCQKRGKYSCKSINVETNIQKQMQHHTKALTTCSTVSQTLLRHNEI